MLNTYTQRNTTEANVESFRRNSKPKTVAGRLLRRIDQPFLGDENRIFYAEVISAQLNALCGFFLRFCALSQSPHSYIVIRKKSLGGLPRGCFLSEKPDAANSMSRNGR